VCPQDEQRRLVALGFTTISSRPASSLIRRLEGRLGRFVRDHRDERPPGRGKDLPVEARLLRHPGAGFLQGAPGGADHVGDLQVFEHHDVIAVHEPPGELVKAVAPAVGDPAVLGCHPGHGLLSPVGAPLLSGEAPLGVRERLPALGEVAGVLKELPVGARRQVGHAEVEAGLPVRGRKSLRRYLGALDGGRQRLPCRRTCSVLGMPFRGRCSRIFTWPMPWRYSRWSGSFSFQPDTSS
jgi:hypothetical protein